MQLGGRGGRKIIFSWADSLVSSRSENDEKEGGGRGGGGVEMRAVTPEIGSCHLVENLLTVTNLVMLFL